MRAFAALNPTDALNLVRKASIGSFQTMQCIDDCLPSDRGSYLLILVLSRHAVIRVGRLGRIEFERGWYAYAGSACGPGGLAARLKRHLEPVKKNHWHIDYLRTAALPLEVWMTSMPPSREHAWAAVLAQGPSAGKWVRGFGCSDCRCPSHLLYFDRRPKRELIREKLGAGVAWLLLAPQPALPRLFQVE